MGIRTALRLLVLTAPACAPLEDGETTEQAQLGSVSLPLQTTSVSGKVYRLRHATFEFTGPTTTKLATAEPAVSDAEQFLRVPLLSGTYSVLLQPGFELWRIAPDGSEGLVTAQLASTNPASFKVVDTIDTPVIFTFNVQDDGKVSFGSGGGRVEIAVNDGDDACTPTPGADLPDDLFKDTNCDGIDGDLTQAVFVAADGVDTNPGTPASPLRTLAAAITRAQANTRTQVYASAGSYPGGLTLANGISIFGGYSRATGWKRSTANVVSIERVLYAAAAGHVIAVQGTDITTATTLDRVSIRAGDAATPAPAGFALYGLKCTHCTGLTVRNSVVTALAGGDGALGADGSPNAAGGPGSIGSVGNPDSSNASAPGGVAGTSTCSRPGGKGGNGGPRATGQAGSVGSTATPGGAGGFIGNPGSAGGNGTSGAAGPNGTSGAATTAGGIDTNGQWSGPAGSTGAVGAAGNGGGGGGGGGGQECGTFCQNGTGNGGGGGGGGGCGGGAGSGGSGAGGSFGVVLVDSTGAQVVASSVTSGGGGLGGKGGNGAAGAFGGTGGSGGTSTPAEIGAGGFGGNGGKGGTGGHGSGGAGGSSFAVVLVRTTLDSSTDTLTVGVPGNGGASQGNAGPAGVSQTIFTRP